MARVSEKFLEKGTPSSFIEDGGFETSITAASTYDDGPGAYVDGAGGAATVLSISRNTTSPLVGSADLKISKSAADASGEGVSLISLPVDSAFRGRKLWISFEWDGSASNYVNGDVKLYAYDVTNSQIMPVIAVAGASFDSSGVSQLPNLRTRVQAYIVPSSTTAQFRLSFHVPTDNASAAAYDLHVDSVEIGPDATVPGAIVTEWQPYTPTFTGFGTPSAVNFRWRRVGGDLEVQGRFTCGASTATEARISFPDGLTSLSSISALEQAGVFAVDAANHTYGTILREPTVAYFTFGRSDSTPTASLLKRNGNAILSSGQTLSLFASVPIQGWSASAALTTTEIGLQTVSASAYRSGNQSIGSAGDVQIQLNAESKDSHAAFSTSTYTWTCPKPAAYWASGKVTVDSTHAGGTLLYSKVKKNGSTVLYSGGVYSVASSNSCTAAGVLVLAAGDQLTLYVGSDSDASYTVLGSSSDTSLDIFEIPDFTVFSALFDNSDVELFIHSFSAYGTTTGTFIPRFSTVAKQTGNGVYYNYVDSVTDGAQVTILVPGTYYVQLCFNTPSTAQNSGITVNDTAKASDIGSLTYAQGRRSEVTNASAGYTGHCSVTLRLSAGDVVRPHTGGVAGSTNSRTFFQLIRIGN